MRVISNAITSLTAIASLTYLGHLGVTDPIVVGAIAGLGGYSIKKHAEA